MDTQALFHLSHFEPILITFKSVSLATVITDVMAMVITDVMVSAICDYDSLK